MMSPEDTPAVQPQPGLFQMPASENLIRIGALLLTLLLVAWISPWLHDWFMAQPKLAGVVLPYAGVALLTLMTQHALTWVALKAWRKTRPVRPIWDRVERRMPRQQAVEEMRDVGPYLEIMGQQIHGALRETEKNVIALIKVISSVHHVSDDQVERIQASSDNGVELSAILKEKVQFDQRLSEVLAMFAAKKEQDLLDNLQHMRRLQEVKALGPLVDVISTVARQTNFLAINAAIEAAHAGESGKGFAVLATEIRQLSNRTASAAVDIADKITKATSGLHAEISGSTHTLGHPALGDDIQTLLSEINDMQSRFSGATLRLMEIFDSVKTGHQDIVLSLSEALGHVQFYDVLRQRVEPVQEALHELNTHLQSVGDQLIEKPWDPDSMISLKQRLLDQIEKYVMQSQRVTHEAVTGDAVTETDERPKIELF